MVYGSSTEPFHPTGFGQLSHEICAQLERVFLPKKPNKRLIFAEIQKYVKDFRKRKDEKEIATQRSKAWIELSDSVKKYIEQVNN
jgi:hypothetical protein